MAYSARKATCEAACDQNPTVEAVEAMRSMNAAGNRIRAEKAAVAEYHRRKYQVFRRMYDDQMACRRLMNRIDLRTFRR